MAQGFNSPSHLIIEGILFADHEHIGIHQLAHIVLYIDGFWYRFWDESFHSIEVCS